MPYFLLRLRHRRASFPFDADAAEKAAMAAHSAFWLTQTERGRALAVGPVFDPAGAWGMALVEVADDDEARDLLSKDPVIEADLGFTYEVLPVPSLLLRRSLSGVSEDV